MGNGYLRFAALGDSTTVGLGDPVPGGGWRGWARLLSEALQASYDVSFCNVAISGATAAIVREQQLAEAVAHRPDLASLLVGVNDTLRSTWDPERLREDLLHVAGELTGAGATLMTVRWHDHGSVLGLPRMVVRPITERIAVVNEVYDEVHATHGGLRLDLALMPEVLDRANWSIDRFHPCEVGHRALARAWAEPGPSGCAPRGSTCRCRVRPRREDARRAGGATSPGWWRRVRRGWGVGRATWGPGPCAGRSRRRAEASVGWAP